MPLRSWWQQVVRRESATTEWHGLLGPEYRAHPVITPTSTTTLLHRVLRQLDQNLLSTNVVVADFNGDGKPDIATSNPTGKSVSVALGRGAGAFNAPASISLGTVQPNSIAAGAFTSGGKPDIVVTDGVSNIEMLFHNGDGTLQKPFASPPGGTKPSFVVTGDFNGDQKLDVAV